MAEIGKRVNIQQKGALVDFMAQNEVFLFGKFNTTKGTGAKSAKWNEIVEVLNSLGPPSKGVEKWKKVSFNESIVA